MPTATSSDQTPVADTASEAALAPRLPLSGLVVLDFGQIFQGPYATLLLAKAGADVIKIEPLHGEPLRRRAAPGKTSTLPFAMLNQNKRGITLNLKHPRGRELLFDMVRRADVLLENFSPGTMDDLGVGWSVLHPLNPRLIYATGTGFGISGPDRDNLAMDLTIQAASGIMSVTGAPDGRPMKAHREVVAIRAADAETGAGGVDEARLSGCNTLQPTPRSSIVPGEKFSSSTSARRTMSNNSSRPRGCFRLRVMPRLF